jgi:heme/copper-type cytochrome/quinol oxidase subunit 2
VATRPAVLKSVPAFSLVSSLLGLAVAGGVSIVAQHARRDVAVTAQKYSYRVAPGDRGEIRVKQDDLVKVTVSVPGGDIPHSFTINEYRINKRVEPGKPVTFEFRADRAGEFEIYCNLTIDDRCQKEMKGRLVVEAKR